MGEYNFIPRKNKKNKIEIHVGMNKIAIIMFLFIFTLLIYSYFRIYNLKAIENQKLLKLEQQNKQKAVVKTSNNKEEIETIKTANTFFRDMDSFVKYSEANINGKQIKCIFSVENEQEYFKLISCIEGYNKYKVKSISPIKSNSAGNSYAEVLLEVIAPQM